MRGLKALLLGLGMAAAPLPALAQEFEDPCAKQRALYPADWDDVSRETPLFTCNARGNFLQVRVGITDQTGRVLMSLVPMRRDDGDRLDPNAGVYRTWPTRNRPVGCAPASTLRLSCGAKTHVGSAGSLASRPVLH
jgi:hypothetical protein